MKIIFGTIFIIFLLQNIVGQQDNILNEKIIKGLNKYRDELFNKYTRSLTQLGLIIQETNKIKIKTPNTRVFDAIYSLDKSSENYLLKNQEVLIKIYGDTNILTRLGVDILKILEDNELLCNGISLGIFEEVYPFKIINNSQYFEEMKFYNIQNGERIGEIGAGDGIFSLLISIIFKDLEIFVNEINDEKIKSIEKGFKNCNSKEISNIITIVKGNQKNPKFINKQFDKIIIRDAFHHFSNKKKMLESIFNCLSEMGHIYIMEPDYNFNIKNEGGCKYVLPETSIIAFFEESGFKLLNQSNLKEINLYEFGLN